MSRGAPIVDPDRVQHDLAKINKVIRKAVIKGIRSGAHAGRAILVKRSPKDTGQLKASWRVSVGEGMEIAQIFNDAPHAGIVEHGARPHPVSEEGRKAIREWVIRHFGFVGTKKRGTRRLVGKNQVTVGGKVRGIGSRVASQRNADMNADVDRVVDGIIHKLETKGQKPTYFVRNSREDLRAVMIAEIGRFAEKASSDASMPKGGRR